MAKFRIIIIMFIIISCKSTPIIIYDQPKLVIESPENTSITDYKE